MTLREGNMADINALQQLFVGTVTTICQSDYNKEQIAAWISSVENKKRWEDIFTLQYVLVAQDNEKIIGFCTLENGNYIDFLYVHKDYQHQGVARSLYIAIEKRAKLLNAVEITSDVSKTARSFFEKMGYHVLTEQIVSRKGVDLTNFKMVKSFQK